MTGRSDVGRPWVRPVGDLVAVVLPPSARGALDQLLRAGAAALPSDIRVDVDDPDGGIRSLTTIELRDIVDRASSACLDALDHAPDHDAPDHDAPALHAPALDEDGFEAFSRGVWLLAELWATAERLTDERLGRDIRAGIGALTTLAADCEEMFVTRLRRSPDGTFSIRWGVVDRRALRGAFAEVRGLLSGDDPSITRLFPSAYGTDAERNAGWDVLMRGELIERRSAALDVADTLIARSSGGGGGGGGAVTADELAMLMRCVNDARLVLGTRLGVDDDGVPAMVERATIPAAISYERLGHVLALIVDALEAGLGPGPAPGSDGGHGPGSAG